MSRFEDWYLKNKDAIHLLSSRKDVAFYVWNNKPTSAVRSAKNEGGYTQEFEEFWNAYPNKIGKGHAYTAWKKIGGAYLLLGYMLKALEWQKKTDQWRSENGKYIPHPTTWLNARRWEDEPVKPAIITEEYYTDINGIKRQRNG